MGRWGKVDYRALKNFRESLERMEKLESDKLCNDLVKELAARALRKVKLLTPVDTGNLRRSWVTTDVSKVGDQYTAEILNEASYAIYVEYGHRTPDHKGWVPGKFMLTKTMMEIEKQMPKIIENKLQTKLREVLDNDK